MQLEFTRYERARILGARALQVAMDAPILLKIEKKELEKINYNPLDIAEMELDADVLPITVRRPMPEKKEGKLKKAKLKVEEEKVEETEEEKKAKEDAKLIAKEKEEEKKIAEEGEIMELAKPEDEVEETEEKQEAGV